MKIKIILALIAPQLALIFGQIYKSSVYLQYSYAKQRTLKELDQLTEKNNELKQILGHLKSPQRIKEFALQQNMEPLKLKQLKKISELYEPKSLPWPTP